MLCSPVGAGVLVGFPKGPYQNVKDGWEHRNHRFSAKWQCGNSTLTDVFWRLFAWQPHRVPTRRQPAERRKKDDTTQAPTARTQTGDASLPALRALPPHGRTHRQNANNCQNTRRQNTNKHGTHRQNAKNQAHHTRRQITPTARTQTSGNARRRFCEAKSVAGAPARATKRHPPCHTSRLRRSSLPVWETCVFRECLCGAIPCYHNGAHLCIGFAHLCIGFHLCLWSCPLTLVPSKQMLLFCESLHTSLNRSQYW